MFYMESLFQNPLKATFLWSSAASLNLGWSQNGVFGNGLSDDYGPIKSILSKCLKLAESLGRMVL